MIDYPCRRPGSSGTRRRLPGAHAARNSGEWRDAAGWWSCPAVFRSGACTHTPVFRSDSFRPPMVVRSASISAMNCESRVYRDWRRKRGNDIRSFRKIHSDHRRGPRTGRALAIGAAQAGATGRPRSTWMRRSLARAARRRPPSITTYVVDVVDRAAFMAAAGRIGRIDGVVNNAMLIRYDAIEAVDEAILDRMLAIGIKGAVWGVQALLRHMDPEVGGVILNLASPVAERGFPEHRRLQHGEGRHGHLHSNPRRGTRSAQACASMRWRRAPFPRPARSPLRRRPSTSGARSRIPLRRLGREEDATNRVAVPAERCGIIHQRRNSACRRRLPGLA